MDNQTRGEKNRGASVRDELYIVSSPFTSSLIIFILCHDSYEVRSPQISAKIICIQRASASFVHSQSPIR